MIEQALHDRLAIIKGAFDGERVNIVGGRRRHHPPLHVGDPAVREQHDQVDIAQARERIDRRTPGIARGCDHDGRALRALRQHMVHQPRDQLHRHVLERERWAVKQLQHELMRPDLTKRNHGGMAKCSVGLVRHAAEIGVRNLAADKRADHIDGDLPIRPAKESGDGFTRKVRPGFGHVETAVAGKPGQHHVAEP
jgi:hypothetical protein